jgi:peptidoglycan/xylan/chitin deacetylase (PgdA/CDA1 family)
MSAERKLLICIDYEGRWGMPLDAPYDLEAATARILDTLAAHDARAIFFVVGELAVDHPDLVRAISSHGHEIGLHGWCHEHADRFPPEQLSSFGDRLAYAASTIEEITGARPTGFRAPYLLAPRFFDARLYRLLAEHGFQWVSNREVRYPIELFRPDRIRSNRPWNFIREQPTLLSGAGARALLLLLNANLYGHAPADLPVASPARWLLDGCPPFYRGTLLEIPVYSPLDCDLVGLPSPSVPTPPALLDYACFALESCLVSPSPVSMLTFHDWIISGGNRLTLLDDLLGRAHQANVRSVTVHGCLPELSRLAGGRRLGQLV